MVGGLYERLIKDVKKTFYKTRGRWVGGTRVMDIEQYPNNCPLMYIYIENELGEEQCRETTSHVRPQSKREYISGLMESHCIKKGLVLVLRGVALQHKGHTIEKPLNLVCSLDIKGPAVVGTAPMAQGPVALDVLHRIPK